MAAVAAETVSIWEVAQVVWAVAKLWEVAKCNNSQLDKCHQVVKEWVDLLKVRDLTLAQEVCNNNHLEEILR